MAFRVHVYNQSQLDALRSSWTALYQQGAEMSYFQSFAWNKMLLRGVAKDSAYFQTLFLAVEETDDGQVVLIAPLFVVKKQYRFIHRPAIYILGNGGWSDYLNFIYASFSPQAVAAVMDYLKAQFPGLLLHVSCLKQSTSLYRYFQQQTTIQSEQTGHCVTLFLPDSAAQWWSGLSKHAKQNIRTARNRLLKHIDNHSERVHIVFDDQQVDKDWCVKVRAVRSKKKLLRDEGKVPLLKQIKRAIKSRLCALPSQGGYLPIKDDNQARIMTISLDGNVMAYFHYNIDSFRQEIVVLSAGVVEDYAAFSPGMLLLEAFVRALMGGEQQSEIPVSQSNAASACGVENVPSSAASAVLFTPPPCRAV